MEEKEIKQVQVGDLVKWQTKERTKVGVVAAIEGDGACTIDITEKGARRTEKIRPQRLEVIISTIKAAAETEPPGNPPLEPPFQKS